jgi:hypothetical protein
LRHWKIIAPEGERKERRSYKDSGVAGRNGGCHPVAMDDLEVRLFDGRGLRGGPPGKDVPCENALPISHQEIGTLHR